MIKQNQKENQSQVVLKWLWFCLLLCVIPKPNKQNQVVKVQPQGLVLVLLLEAEPHNECCKYDLYCWMLVFLVVLFILLVLFSRTFQVTAGGVSTEINQLQTKQWPDKGVPKNTKLLRNITHRAQDI